MKKITIKILLLFTFILLFLGIDKVVEANSIDKISMDIYVDKNGNANITEIWNCSTDSGTEVYHPYYNLGNSEISDLNVFDETKQYTTLQEWNTSGTLQSKAYKCGINEIENGIELCWGISSYGTHTYKVTYKISKFVSELTDSQMIYWTLIPHKFSNSIENMKIKIYADFPIEDTIDVWGYGNYGGLCYVKNGAIYMESDGKLKTNEYMTILAKFPLNTFNTKNKLNKDFDYYFDMAEEGAKKYNKSGISKIFEIIIMIFGIMFMIFIEFLPIIIFVLIIKNIKPANNFEFGEEGEKIPKDILYYRDIPCEGDLYKAYYIAYRYDLVKNKSDLLGAIILKWLKDGIVKTNKVEVGMIRKKLDTVIELTNTNVQFENPKDQELFSMLYEASKDGILEKKEFEKWCSGKYSKILNWFDNILVEERNKLVKEGIIIESEQTSMKIFKKKIYTATPELKNKAIELAGLKKYLLEYTLIKNKEPMEVILFENYLIYAQLMGIAKKVAKEFKDLYPELIEQSHYVSYDDILFVHYCSATGVSSADRAKSAAESAATSYSGGGGGFSSGGGGGGSFGGGSGRRRIPLKNKI